MNRANNNRRRNRRGNRNLNRRNRRGRGLGKRRGRMRTNNLGGRIVPDRVRVKLAVTSFVTYQFLSASFYATYKGNDLVNPGNSTWVNQPAGFIDWMQFYHRFRVLGSRISFQMVNDGDVARNRAIWVCIYPTIISDASLFTGGFINAKAQPYARSSFVGSPTGQDRSFVSNAIGTSKFWGSNVMFDDDFAGIVDTSPVNQWYWGIACTGLSDGGTEFATLTLMVTISYDVIFYDRVPITMTFPGLEDINLEKPYLHSNDLNDFKDEL